MFFGFGTYMSQGEGSQAFENHSCFWTCRKYVDLWVQSLRFIVFWPLSFIDAYGCEAQMILGFGAYILWTVKAPKSFQILESWASLTEKRSVGLQFIILLSLQLHRCLRCDSHVFRAYDSQSLPLKSLPTFSPRHLHTKSLGNVWSTPQPWPTAGLPFNPYSTLSTNTCCAVRNLEGKTAMFECRSVAQCYILIWPKRIKQEQKKREWNSRNTTDTCQSADYSSQEIGAPKREVVWKEKT